MIINRIFKLKKLQAGAERYGDCEICNKHVDRTYLLTVSNIALVHGVEHILNGPLLFGHKKCLSMVTCEEGASKC
ncbi:hypothetical protein VIBNIFTn2_120188 [Vibrio nigripulchritudo FTn2]|nr:hypothetical protein VIBNIFTn2_120188 [Vibrio nigripulchritudo FTn2]